MRPNRPLGQVVEFRLAVGADLLGAQFGIGQRRRSLFAAIYEAGFNSNGRFYATSSDRLGMTPTQFRAGGRDADIRFALGQCSLGTILERLLYPETAQKLADYFGGPTP